MFTTIFEILLFLAGLTFAIHGVRLLFQKGYVERRLKRVEQYSSAKSDHFYFRYLEGIEGTVAGLLLMSLPVYTFYAYIFLPRDPDAYIKCQAIELGSTYDEVVAVMGKNKSEDRTELRYFRGGSQQKRG